MKNLAATDADIEMGASGIDTAAAKSIITGRNVLEELQDISSKIEYGVHPDHTAQQLARLTDVLIFMVAHGSIKF